MRRSWMGFACKDAGTMARAVVVSMVLRWLLAAGVRGDGGGKGRDMVKGGRAGLL